MPFPGSASLSAYLVLRDFGMPQELAGRIRKWQAVLDPLEPGEENPDHETSNAEGRQVRARQKEPTT